MKKMDELLLLCVHLHANPLVYNAYHHPPTLAKVLTFLREKEGIEFRSVRSFLHALRPERYSVTVVKGQIPEPLLSSHTSFALLSGEDVYTFPSDHILKWNSTTKEPTRVDSLPPIDADTRSFLGRRDTTRTVRLPHNALNPSSACYMNASIHGLFYPALNRFFSFRGTPLKESFDAYRDAPGAVCFRSSLYSYAGTLGTGYSTRRQEDANEFLNGLIASLGDRGNSYISRLTVGDGSLVNLYLDPMNLPLLNIQAELTVSRSDMIERIARPVDGYELYGVLKHAGRQEVGRTSGHYIFDLDAGNDVFVRLDDQRSDVLYEPITRDEFANDPAYLAVSLFYKRRPVIPPIQRIPEPAAPAVPRSAAPAVPRSAAPAVPRGAAPAVPHSPLRPEPAAPRKPEPAVPRSPPQPEPSRKKKRPSAAENVSQKYPKAPQPLDYRNPKEYIFAVLDWCVKHDVEFQ
jgi:hypothetical protein